MFETKTYESILSDMLTNISVKNPELDVSTGSIIYTALAPVAMELETAYHEMDMILEETFLETASKEYLIKHGDQLGVEIHEATFGSFKGEFDVDLEIGSRFNLDKFNYNAISKISDPTEDYPYYVFEMVCETAGSEPNGYLGDLTPITYVENLTHAKLISVIVYGEDEEETEDYRYRIQIHAKNPASDGNVAQYNEWLDDYDGVGKYEVKPCWNGINTVKLTILNAKNTAASKELIDEVQAYFDPNDSDINDNVNNETYPQGRGMGNGQAPIGSIVTVDTVTEVPVVIACQLKLKSGYTSPVGVQEGVVEYLESISLNKSSVGYMPISAEIYNAESVEDVLSLAITVKGTRMAVGTNPFIDSVSLGDDEIAILDVENSVWGV